MLVWFFFKNVFSLLIEASSLSAGDPFSRRMARKKCVLAFLLPIILLIFYFFFSSSFLVTTTTHIQLHKAVCVCDYGKLGKFLPRPVSVEILNILYMLP